MIKKIVISLIIFFGVISFVQAENTWIKKKDKTEKVKKVEKKKTSNWIKKKEVKENKKKLKEKIKESKSWISKKSKDKVKDIKEKLKKHKNIDQLPKAELYFAIAINPSEDEGAEYIYGYINSDKNSEVSKKFRFKSKNFYSHNDGIAFFDDNQTTCQIDVLKDEVFGELKGKAIIKCKNKEVFAADINFEKDGKSGKGYNIVFKGGRSGELEFSDTKTTTIAKLETYKTDTNEIVERKIPSKNKKKIFLKPNGKYYALLIGNSKYTNGWEDLVSPINDINAIKEVLDEKYDFEEILMVNNGTKKDIYKAFTDLSKLTTTNDYVLIYYSGHGQIKAEQAYWIPTDGSENWGSGDWINIAEIDIFLTDIKAHHLAVLVDSCFVGSKFKGMNIIDSISMSDQSSEHYGKYLESALTLRSRSVLASGTTGQVSDTVKGTGHSKFALSILNQLNVFDKQSYPLDIESMAVLMKGNFTKFQKPFMYHPDSWRHGGGTFIFIPKKNLK